MHEGRQVVRPHIEDRAGAALEEEVGVLVPLVGARALHGGRRGQGLTDVATGDRAQCALHAAPEHGVGRDADAQPLLGGALHELPSGLAVDGDRLLAPHVLARVDRGERDLGVHGRDRQVHHELHVRVGEDVRRAAGVAHAVLLGLRSRAVGVDVADRDDLDLGELREVLQVGVADHPCADESDAQRLTGHAFSPSMSVRMPASPSVTPS